MDIVDNIPNLDCSVSIAGGRVKVETDVTPKSRSPATSPIPYSLSCKERNQWMEELKEMLLQRGVSSLSNGWKK